MLSEPQTLCPASLTGAHKSFDDLAAQHEALPLLFVTTEQAVERVDVYVINPSAMIVHNSRGPRQQVRLAVALTERSVVSDLDTLYLLVEERSGNGDPLNSLSGRRWLN